MLLGCSGGLLDTAKIKGIHGAMLSGILAAEETAKALISQTLNPQTLNPQTLNPQAAREREVIGYEERLKASWLWKELQRVRDRFRCMRV